MRSHQDDIKAPNSSVLHIVGAQHGQAIIGVLYQNLGDQEDIQGLPSITPGRSVPRTLHVSVPPQMS